MKIIETIVEFNNDIENVYQAIIDNTVYSWRSDLDRIEIVSDTQFIEYNRKDFPTTMTITSKKEKEEYIFTLENKNIKGEWIGKCSSLNEGRCQLYIKESIMIKPILLRPFIFLMNIKKLQDLYISDLKKYLQEKR